MNSIHKAVRISNPLLSGLIYAAVFVVILTAMTSLLLTITSMKEASIPLFVYLIHGISVSIGGFISGKRAGSRGWYHGSILGGIYTLLVLMIGFLGFNMAFNLSNALLLAIALLMGAFGGIFGVNAAK